MFLNRIHQLVALVQAQFANKQSTSLSPPTDPTTLTLECPTEDPERQVESTKAKKKKPKKKK